VLEAEMPLDETVATKGESGQRPTVVTCSKRDDDGCAQSNPVVRARKMTETMSKTQNGAHLHGRRLSKCLITLKKFLVAGALSKKAR
jgi:hypothetical protein